MYAIVEIAGQQFQVKEGAVVRVPKLDLEEGARQVLSEVLLVRTDGTTQVGSPHVDGASVETTVLGHGRAEKIVVFKIKRRKNYRRRRGHRQNYTELKVDGIVAPN